MLSGSAAQDKQNGLLSSARSKEKIGIDINVRKQQFLTATVTSSASQDELFTQKSHANVAHLGIESIELRSVGFKVER